MVRRLQEQVGEVVAEMNKAGLGVEVHTRPRGTHDWRETPASEVLDARALKAAAQAGLSSRSAARPLVSLSPLKETCCRQ